MVRAESCRAIDAAWLAGVNACGVPMSARSGRLRRSAFAYIGMAVGRGGTQLLRCSGQRPGPSPGTNSPQDCLCPGSVPRPATRASSFYLRNCVTPHPTAAPLGVLDEEAERRASGQWGGPDAQVKEEGRVADRGTWSIRPAPLSAPIRSTKSMNGRTAQVAGGSRPALQVPLHQAVERLLSGSGERPHRVENCVAA